MMCCAALKTARSNLLREKAKVFALISCRISTLHSFLRSEFWVKKLISLKIIQIKKLVSY